MTGTSRPTDVPGGLGALGDYGVGFGPDEAAGQGHRGYDRGHFDSGVLEGPHVRPGVARARGDRRHSLPADEVDDVGGVRGDEQDVHAEGTAGAGPDPVYLFLDPGRIAAAGPDEAQAPGGRDGGGQLGRAEPGHPAEEDGVLEAEELREPSAERCCH